MQKKTRARSPLACLHMHHVKPASRPYYYEHNDLRRRVLMGGGPAAKIWLALAAARTHATPNIHKKGAHTFAGGDGNGDEDVCIVCLRPSKTTGNV